MRRGEIQHVPSLGVEGTSSPASLETLSPLVLAGEGSREGLVAFKEGAEGVPAEADMLIPKVCVNGWREGRGREESTVQCSAGR